MDFGLDEHCVMQDIIGGTEGGKVDEALRAERGVALLERLAQEGHVLVAAARSDRVGDVASAFDLLVLVQQCQVYFEAERPTLETVVFTLINICCFKICFINKIQTDLIKPLQMHTNIDMNFPFAENECKHLRFDCLLLSI